MREYIGVNPHWSTLPLKSDCPVLEAVRDVSQDRNLTLRASDENPPSFQFIWSRLFDLLCLQKT